jgi:hypothetical protein
MTFLVMWDWSYLLGHLVDSFDQDIFMSSQLPPHRDWLLLHYDEHLLREHSSAVRTLTVDLRLHWASSCSTFLKTLVLPLAV